MAASAARFERRTHRGRRYRLFVPSRIAARRRVPLVVMLHGCGQDASAFAHDTGMNRLAEAETFLVLYPEQTAVQNPRRCWNWFEPAHQARGAGEPAEIVALVDAVAARFPVDPRRVYVAGLSAGAAMSVVLGATYPDRFAAIGIAAGLPYQAASDCFDALTLMQRVGERMRGGEWFGPLQDYWRAYVACFSAAPSGPRLPFLSPVADPDTLGERAVQAMGEHRRVVPLILFQGTGDTLVRPANGESLVGQWNRIGDLASERFGTTEISVSARRTEVPGGRSYTVRSYRDGAGRTLLRAYVVEGMGHSWPGGAPDGSVSEAAGPLTDPLAPDATRLIWQFFRDNPMPRTAVLGRRPLPTPGREAVAAA